MKKEDKSERLSDALGDLPQDMIRESGSYTPALTRRARRIRALSVILAAVILLSAIPLGLFLFRKPEFPIPEPIAFSDGFFSGTGADVPEELSSVRIRAEGTDSRVIPADACFLVETAGETDSVTLASYLSISPDVPASVTQLSATSFKVSPASGRLAPGQIYRLTIGDPDNPVASYAFQTEYELIVSSVFPGQRGLNVPVDTGIEVCFSDSVRFRADDPPFEISPSVKGSYSLCPDGRTVVFVPQKPLAFDTVYTIRVKAGTASLSGKTLAEDYESCFRTAAEGFQIGSSSGTDWVRLYLTSYDLVYSPGTPMPIRATFHTHLSGVQYDSLLTCNLYAYRTAEDAASVNARTGGLSTFNPDRMDKIGSYEFAQGDKDTQFALELPKGLPVGLYAARITATARSLGKNLSAEALVFVQVTDLRAYTVSSDGKTYVWLNRTGQGAETGADLSAVPFDQFEGWDPETSGSALTAKTDGNGIALFETGGRNACVITVRSGEDVLIVSAQCAETDVSDYYMHYVYTDRAVYFPDDTVRFGGLLTGSFGETVPDTLYLKTSLSSRTVPVAVDENGIFSGSLTLESVSAGYYSLFLTNESGTVLSSKSFRVTEESKPQYTATLTLDKLYYKHGDTVCGTIRATFFDGTPAEGLTFVYRANAFATSQKEGVTDRNGEIRFSFQTGYLDSNSVWSTDPFNLRVKAELVGYETQTLTVLATAPYFHSQYVFGVEYGDTTRALTLNLRDLSGIQSAEDLRHPAFPANTIGDPVDMADAVSYSLIKHTYEKIQTTRYDAYLKRNVTAWNYHYSKVTEKTGKLSFVGGRIELPTYDTGNTSSYYTYKIQFFDASSQHTYTRTVDASPRSYYSSNGSDYRVLHLNAERYSCGDTVEATYLSGGSPERALFVVTGYGIEQVSCGTGVSFPFTGDMIAGGSVSAVAFDAEDGTYFRKTLQLYYDTEKNALSPEIRTDKDQYRPGEKATVSFRVPGASGGTLIASIADEACFALGDQDPDPSGFYFSSGSGESPYRYYYFDYGDTYAHYSYYYFRSSYGSPGVLFDARFTPENAVSYSGTDKATFGMDEQTEFATASSLADREGNDSTSEQVHVRENFSDNPEFAIIRLDENGCGTLTFTVPDNITSWRITAVAFTNEGSGPAGIRAGAATSDTVCTQPFFINLGACQNYIRGDTVSVSARAYGTLAEGTVSYTAYLTSEDGRTQKKVTASADAKQRAWLKFEGLDTGRYTVTVYAVCGNQQDAMTVRLSVIETAVSAEVRKEVRADEISSLSPVLYPVTLSFTLRTEALALYERSAAVLSRNRGSGRSDEFAALYASYLAQDRLYGTDHSDELSACLRGLGDNAKDLGFGLFPYSDADLALTAQILSLGLPLSSQIQNRIRSLALKRLTQTVQTSPEAVCQTLVILAALDEPVLDRLYAIASVAQNYPDEAKLYLALGFALCGDYPAAHDIYVQIRDRIGARNEEYGTLRFGEDGTDADTRIRFTSLALLTAARTDRADAAELTRWLLENQSDRESAQIALSTYLKYFLPAGTAEAKTLTYSTGEETREVSLTLGKVFSLTLSRYELENLDLNVPEGISIYATYRGTAEETLSGTRADSSRVRIEKTMMMRTENMCIVTLHIYGTSTRVSEYFDLYDLIPSGARFFRMGSKGYGSSLSGGIRTSAWLYNSSGQNMNGGICVCNEAFLKNNNWDYRLTECPEYSFDVEVSYVIRGALEGTFISESAFLKNERTGVFSVSERITVHISENSAWTFERQ